MKRLYSEKNSPIPYDLPEPTKPTKPDNPCKNCAYLIEGECTYKFKPDLSEGMCLQKTSRKGFWWYMERIKPCLKRIAEDNTLTEGKGSDGLKMNLTLISSLLYLKAPRSYIYRIFKKREKYSQFHVDEKITFCRETMKIEHITIKCETIKKRGFCIECWRDT